jgi:hypothetical protein
LQSEEDNLASLDRVLDPSFGGITGCSETNPSTAVVSLHCLPF